MSRLKILFIILLASSMSSALALDCAQYRGNQRLYNACLHSQEVAKKAENDFLNRAPQVLPKNSGLSPVTTPINPTITTPPIPRPLPPAAVPSPTKPNLPQHPNSRIQYY
jgi:hypothetical protein